MEKADDKLQKFYILNPIKNYQKEGKKHSKHIFLYISHEVPQQHETYFMMDK